eukprot:Phypoly_transcript_27381.p1 GENE.Phypoly_transcript_27381~~Phypoly_transcript_27381.p1  ORF type:complete len:104 (+),score=9.19 Phypoly_transcript_27381:157-468(+)
MEDTPCCQGIRRSAGLLLKDYGHPGAVLLVKRTPDLVHAFLLAFPVSDLCCSKRRHLVRQPLTHASISQRRVHHSTAGTAPLSLTPRPLSECHTPALLLHTSQ